MRPLVLLFALAVVCAPLAATASPWPFDLQHVALELTPDLIARRLDGTVRMRLAVRAATSALTLEAAAQVKIRSATIAGRPAKIAHARPPRLVLTADRPLAAGAIVLVTIAYRVENSRLGVYFVGPDSTRPDAPRQMYTQSEPEEGRHWWPGYHHPDDRASSEVTVVAPAGMTVISNGRLLKVEPAGTGRRFHWRQDVPHSTYLISVVVGELVKIDLGRVRDIPLEGFVEPVDRQRAPNSLSRTKEMFVWFEALLGQPFPFRKYAQTCVRDYKWGGMEHSGATTLTRRTLHDARATLDHSSEGLVAHELAHQWFGDALTCRSFSHLWLNEGFATYFTHLWIRKRFGEDRFRLDVDGAGRGPMGADDKKPLPVVRLKYDKAWSMFDGRSYGKGGRVLHMLRQILGDDVFWRGIRGYTKTHWLKTVVTADLQRSMEAAAGRSLATFFDQWLHKPGYPKLKVRARQRDGELLLDVEQIQPANKMPSVFQTPVDIAVGLADKRLVRRFELNARTQTLRWPLGAAPDYIRFNDGGWLLCRVDFPRPLGELIAQVRRDTDAVGRRRALEQLDARFRTRIASQRTLAAVAATDASWQVREQALRLLGKAGGTLAWAAALDAAGDRHAKVRRAAAELLAAFKGPETEHTLRDLLARDRSYYVVAASLRGLCKHGVKDTDALLKHHAALPSHASLYRRTVLQLRADRGNAGDLKAVREATTTGPLRVREEAVRLLPRLVKRDAKAVRDALVGLLTVDGFRLRREVVRTLGKLADPATQAALDRVAAKDADERIRGDAKGALKAIAKKLAKAGDPLAKRQAELERLLARKTLEAELAAIETKILELELKKVALQRKLAGKK